MEAVVADDDDDSSVDSDDERAREERRAREGPSQRSSTPAAVKAEMAAELAAMHAEVQVERETAARVEEDRAAAEAAIATARDASTRRELGRPIPRDLAEYRPGDARPLSASELRALNLSRAANNLEPIAAPELPPDSRWLARPRDSVFHPPPSRERGDAVALRPEGSRCFYMVGEMRDESETGVQYIIEAHDLWRPCTWLAARAIERLQEEGGEYGPRVRGMNGYEGESDTWVEVGPYKRYPIDTPLDDIPDGATVVVRWRNHPDFVQKRVFSPPAPEELPDYERYEAERTWELMEPPYPRDEFYELECDAHCREPRGALSELETYLFAKYKYETAVGGVARELRATAATGAEAARGEVKALRLGYERQRAELDRAAIEYDRQARELEAMKRECLALEGFIEADDRE